MGEGRLLGGPVQSSEPEDFPGSDNQTQQEETKIVSPPSTGRGVRVTLSPNAINPKVPVAAFGAIEIARIISWLSDSMGLYMPWDVSLALSAGIAWVIAMYVPFRQD